MQALTEVDRTLKIIIGVLALTGKSTREGTRDVTTAQDLGRPKENTIHLLHNLKLHLTNLIKNIGEDLLKDNYKQLNNRQKLTLKQTDLDPIAATKVLNVRTKVYRQIFHTVSKIKSANITSSLVYQMK